MTRFVTAGQNCCFKTQPIRHGRIARRLARTRRRRNSLIVVLCRNASLKETRQIARVVRSQRLRQLQDFLEPWVVFDASPVSTHPQMFGALAIRRGNNFAQNYERVIAMATDEKNMG